jgi:hypothetical protein
MTGDTMEGFDANTGELADVPLSERAIAAGRTERAERAERKHSLVVGSGNLNTKIDAALNGIVVLKNNKLEKDKAGQRGDYTSYDRILSIIVPRLRAQGVIIRHNAGRVITIDKTFWLPVTCYLIDKATGESVECEIPFPIVQVTPHAVASAFMYGKRISTLGVLGLATGAEGEDDNGEAAMPRDMDEDSEADVLIRELEATATEAEATKWKAGAERRFKALEPEDFANVRARYQTHIRNLRAGSADDAAAPPTPKPKGGPKNRIAPTTADEGRA